MSDAAAVWRENVAALTAAFDPSQPRVESGPNGGQWTSDGDNGGDAPVDQATKDAYAALLGMTPAQRADFLAKMPPDQLAKLGAFAATGKSTKGDIAQIKNAVGDVMKSRGMDPASVGLKAKAGKKKAAKKGGAKKSGGGGSKGGGGKSGGGSSSKKSGGSKSSGSKSSGSKSGSKSSGSKSSGSKSSSGTSKTTPPKAPPKPPPPPPALDRVGPRRRPGLPSPSPGLPRPVRSSAAPESLADWNAARYAARQARS